jgi:hypothetical protein
MDKVKIALAWLKKYHFWVMTAMVVLIGMIGWFTATSKLWAEYQANRAKIDERFKAMKKINQEEQKNDQWIKGIEEETNRLKAKVAQAWKKVYIEQRDQVLTWPKILGPDSIAELERLGPNGEIPRPILEKYYNYIRSEFPRLLKIVDAEDVRKTKTAGAARTDGDLPTHDYKVKWDEKSESEIAGQLNWSTTPTSPMVREAQENLWVYEALLNIIKNLNKNAKGNYNAKVKRIEELLIGREAASAFQAGMAEGRVERAEGAAAANQQTQNDSSKAEGRYVNEKGAPLTANDPSAAEVTEFKRMPVLVKLVMDQRELSRLLVECANSPLPVEVRQFRVYGQGRSEQNVAAAAVANPNAEKAQAELSANDVTVELQGIIYIFNPPDRAKLGDEAKIEPAGVQAAAAQAAAEGEPDDGKTPAAAVPAAPAVPGEPAAPAAPENPGQPEKMPAGAPE